ncbi:MAG: hypothetical protein RLZZ451_349 [Pseudomonadota bacterium]
MSGERVGMRLVKQPNATEKGPLTPLQRESRAV